MAANITPITDIETPDEFSLRPFSFTEKDFHYLRKLITAHTSIQISEMKREMVYGRVSRRLRLLGLNSFAEYCELLKDESSGELGNLINVITTNLTSFLRERHHFEYLTEAVLPVLKQTNSTRQRIRIWSAGCSTGEEAYSIAITLWQARAMLQDWDLKILATDIDTRVIQQAREGVYRMQDVEPVLEKLRDLAFLRGVGANAGRVRIKPEIQNLVTFLPLNLTESWPMRGQFDIVFCRNVVIYFDRETQARLFNRFADILAPGGHLFIGHSETLFSISDRFELIGQTIYRKKA